MGVFHADLVGIQVRVLQRLARSMRSCVWPRQYGEVSLGASTSWASWSREIREYEIHPEDFGCR